MGLYGADRHAHGLGLGDLRVTHAAKVGQRQQLAPERRQARQRAVYSGSILKQRQPGLGIRLGALLRLFVGGVDRSK